MTWINSSYLLRIIILIIKNALGVLLLVMGMLMLILPGQGLLTILAGLVLLDFPGKFLLLRWLVRKEKILKSLNWLRHKGRKEPFVI